MTLPSNANLPNYPAFADAREYDAEFLRMVMQGAGIMEGVAPATPGTSPMADFKVTTGASGLNVSVAAGRAFVQGDTRSTQGLYFCLSGAAETVTIPAAHATLPRIDAIVLQVVDADVSGSATNWDVTYQSGTATASAHIGNPATASWLAGAPGQAGGPSLQADSMILAYVLTPALFAGPYVNATHILDGRAHYLGQPMSYIATADTTTSASYVMMGTNPATDGVWLDVPANALIRLRTLAAWKISVASGTQTVGMFLNGTQLKDSSTSGAPVADELAVAPIATTYSRVATTVNVSNTIFAANSSSDVSNVATGQVIGGQNIATAPLEIFGLTAGRYFISQQYKTSANTLTVKERFIWAELIRFN